MGVFGAGVDLELGVHLAAEFVLREHAADRFFDEAFGVLLLDLAEGVLKGRLENRVASGAGLAACENIQGIPQDPFADVVRIVLDSSALPPEDARLVDRALGTGPIRVDAAPAGAGP